MRDDKITRQQMLAMGYEGYARHHRLPDYVRRAVWAILACRTALLGGHVQACPDGHLERIWDNSCRHRMCPPCAWVPTERWLARQKARLLACEPYHVIFTRPHELHALWLANVEAMSQLLFASVQETLCELLGDAKYLGAKPGVIATLHTWSQTLLLHPHLHCLVTGGGLTAASQWVAVRNGFLLPMRVVMAVFRGKLRAAIRQGLHQGRLTPPEGKSRQQVDNGLNKLGRQKWHVHIRERYPHGTGVLIYLARYLRGGPIANRRLLAWDGQQVVFRQSAVRFVGSGWCARPSSPGPESHHPLRRIGRRWHEEANSRGRLEASLLGIGAPCSGAFKRSPAPRRPRCRPMLVPTAPRAGDVCLEMERFEVGIALQAP